MEKCKLSFFQLGFMVSETVVVVGKPLELEPNSDFNFPSLLLLWGLPLPELLNRSFQLLFLEEYACIASAGVDTKERYELGSSAFLALRI